jgi:hypothetical protein
VSTHLPEPPRLQLNLTYRRDGDDGLGTVREIICSNHLHASWCSTGMASPGRIGVGLKARALPPPCEENQLHQLHSLSLSLVALRTGQGAGAHPCGPLPPLAQPRGTVSGPSGPTRSSTALNVTARRRASPSVCSRPTMAHVPWMSTCHGAHTSGVGSKGPTHKMNECGVSRDCHHRWFRRVPGCNELHTWHGTPSTSRSAMFCTRPASASITCVTPFVERKALVLRQKP